MYGASYGAYKLTITKMDDSTVYVSRFNDIRYSQRMTKLEGFIRSFMDSLYECVCVAAGISVSLAAIFGFMLTF